MKAQDVPFVDFLEGKSKRFYIPIYQRNYSWKEEQCSDLFNSLIEIKNNNFKNHFLGSIVYLNTDGKSIIIDGQQRITSLSLLFLAMCHLLKSGEISSTANTAQKIEDMIYSAYLYNEYKGEIKLKLNEHDNPYYEKAFKQIDDSDYSKIYQNYNYFVSRVREGKISVDDLYLAIEKLVIVDVVLNEKDNPQLIFESLNSTGLDLTDADKIRNFVLMKHDSETQEKLYKDYWYKIELNAGDKITIFIKHYLTMLNKQPVADKQIYTDFKKHVGENKDETVLKNLLKFSKFYKNIILPGFKNELLNESIKNINKLEVTTSYPFLLELMDWHEQKIIDDAVLLQITSIIESFIFRRSICGIAPNSLNGIFAALASRIKLYKNYETNILETFKYLMISGEYSIAFPSDYNVKESLVVKNVYKMQQKNKDYLFQSLENFDNKEPVLLNNLTIEHIMPQTLSRAWKKELGDNWQETHEKYLHTIGNLTLTGYNSEMQNETFLIKRDAEYGFKQSGIYLNKYLKELDFWTGEQIEERAEKLIERILKIWVYPFTNYKPEKISNKLNSIYLLSNDEDIFVGKKIISFVYNNIKYKVDSWQDFMVNIFDILIKNDHEKFYNLVKDNAIGSILSFDGKYNNGNLYIKTKELIPGKIFLELGLGVESICRYVKKALVCYDIPDDDIKLELESIKTAEI